MTFSAELKPFSKYIDPIKASKLSAKTLSSITFFLFLEPRVKTYLCNSIFFAISKHVFLFTKEANFLSKIPSFSFGYISINFLEIIKPNTLSPKNSYQNFYELMILLIGVYL